MTMTSDATTPSEHEHDGATIDTSDDADRLENRETEPSTEIVPTDICISFQERVFDSNNSRVTTVQRDGDEIIREHVGNGVPEDGNDEPCSFPSKNSWVVGYLWYDVEKGIRSLNKLNNDGKIPKFNGFLGWSEQIGRFVPVDPNQETLINPQRKTKTKHITVTVPTATQLLVTTNREEYNSEADLTPERNTDTSQRALTGEVRSKTKEDFAFLDLLKGFVDNSRVVFRWILTADELERRLDEIGIKLDGELRDIPDLTLDQSELRNNNPEESDKKITKEKFISAILHSEIRSRKKDQGNIFLLPLYSGYDLRSDNDFVKLFRRKKDKEKLKLLKQEKPRKYRKREELPDPTSSPKAEVNRSSKKLSPRVSVEHFQRFNEIAKNKALFESPRSALERAIDLLSQECSPDNGL